MATGTFRTENVEQESSSVNTQITDSVTQTNVSTLAATPAMAMGNLMTSMGQALANSSHNATSGQQYSNQTAQSATIQNINAMTAISTAVIGRTAESVVENTQRSE